MSNHRPENKRIQANIEGLIPLIIRQIQDMFLTTDLENLNYIQNPEVKKLLDAIVSILVEEYLQSVKKNPAMFID